jgi:hypothetical protein
VKRIAFLAALAAALQSGCATATAYHPAVTAPGELTLSYGNGVEVWNGQKQVARSFSYEGLPDFVRCVPDAARHAEAARDAGRSAALFSGLGIGLALTGTAGGLTGAELSRSSTGVTAFLVGGLVMEVAAVTFGALSLGQKSQANGHASDAVNYYNDAVGSVGQVCP